MIRLLLLIIILSGCAQKITPTNKINTNKEITDDDVLVVVVHESNPIENLNISRLALIYQAKKLYWPNGKDITCVGFPRGSVERESFSQLVLRKSSFQMIDYWVREATIGKPIDPPISIGTGNRLLRFLSDEVGGIGYLRLKEYKFLKENKKYKVKAITINNETASVENIKKGKYILTLLDNVSEDEYSLFY